VFDQSQAIAIQLFNSILKYFFEFAVCILKL